MSGSTHDDPPLQPTSNYSSIIIIHEWLPSLTSLRTSNNRSEGIGVTTAWRKEDQQHKEGEAAGMRTPPLYLAITTTRKRQKEKVEKLWKVSTKESLSVASVYQFYGGRGSDTNQKEIYQRVLPSLLCSAASRSAAVCTSNKENKALAAVFSGRRSSLKKNSALSSSHHYLT